MQGIHDLSKVEDLLRFRILSYFVIFRVLRSWLYYYIKILKRLRLIVMLGRIFSNAMLLNFFYFLYYIFDVSLVFAMVIMFNLRNSRRSW